jgi:POT family proton-dependent oligopeptide transporter
MLWLFNLYLIHTVGELFLSPIGLSMVNKLSPTKFASLLMGVWFLSTSAANKFAGMLSALYPENGVSTNFFGYHISSLYDFFMLFVVMAGIASVILFLLSRRLMNMMHGLV